MGVHIILVFDEVEEIILVLFCVGEGGGHYTFVLMYGLCSFWFLMVIEKSDLKIVILEHSSPNLVFK